MAAPGSTCSLILGGHLAWFYLFVVAFCFSSLPETDLLETVMRGKSIHHKVLNLVSGNKKCSLLPHFSIYLALQLLPESLFLAIKTLKPGLIPCRKVGAQEPS